MEYPVIIFNDSTDYEAAEILLLQLFSDLNQRGGCCKSKPVERAFIQSTPFLENRVYDKETSLTRWENDVKSAYLILQEVS